MAPVDEAGDEETKQLLEGDESLLGPQQIPQAFLNMFWKVCGCLSIVTTVYLGCFYLRTFLFLHRGEE